MTSPHQLVKVSFSFGVGTLIILILAAWGVISGVMSPIPTIAISMIALPIALFSLSLWYHWNRQDCDCRHCVSNECEEGQHEALIDWREPADDRSIIDRLRDWLR